jgi:hypothetical protein
MDDNIIRQMRFACWINKVKHARSIDHDPTPISLCTHTQEAQVRARAHTHTHTDTEICKSCRFSTARMVTLTRLTVTLYIHCMSCVLSGRVLCVMPITRPGKSYPVCVSLCVTKCNNTPLHQQWDR